MTPAIDSNSGHCQDSDHGGHSLGHKTFPFAKTVFMFSHKPDQMAIHLIRVTYRLFCRGNHSSLSSIGLYGFVNEFSNITLYCISELVYLEMNCSQID